MTLLHDLKVELKAWGLHQPDEQVLDWAQQINVSLPWMGPAARLTRYALQEAAGIPRANLWNTITIAALHRLAPQKFEPRRAIDYACGYVPNVAVVMLKHDVALASRYIAPGPANAWKNVSRYEIASLRDRGRQVALFYETSAGWMLGGRNVGRDAARTAKIMGMDIGAPGRAVIYFCADFDVQPRQVAPVLDCLAGARDIIGDRAGLYGGLRIITAAQAAGCRHLFQTLAWSYGRWHLAAAMRQIDIWPRASYGSLGIEYDSEVQLAADVGQF